ncbi:hypothetical protein [Candidatus Entotheonella palauensis]|uniref:hypothetical protein n=1 Tax=Candidatus Entotheonella palauensis TaxID=93172 RepID=UPI0015C438AF|nr:hypothetical protein [Candidatus Entotheonella palauensis]
MTTLTAALHWRPHPPFFYGWLVLGTGALGAFVATSIAGVVLGGIQDLIVEETGWNRSTIGLAAAVGCGDPAWWRHLSGAWPIATAPGGSCR